MLQLFVLPGIVSKALKQDQRVRAGCPTSRVVTIAVVDYGISRGRRSYRIRSLVSIRGASLGISLFQLIAVARGRSKSIVTIRRVILHVRWTRSGVRRNTN